MIIRPRETETGELLLGRYRTVGKLVPNMVLPGTDEHTRLPVTIFVCMPRRGGGSPLSDIEQRALSLSHSLLLPCLASAEDERQRLWVVVFPVKSGTLRALMSAGPVRPALLAKVLADVGTALSFAHARGLLHKRLSPDCIYTARSELDTPWLLADLAGIGRPKSESPNPYAAPELQSPDATAASDQYALGMLGLEALCGGLPGAGSISQMLLRHRWDSGLLGILARMAAPLAEDRFPSLAVAAQLLRSGPACLFDLQRTLSGESYLWLDGEVLRVVPAAPIAAAESEIPTLLQLATARYSLADAGVHPLRKDSGARTPHFVHPCTEPTPLLATERRILQLQGNRPVTLYVAEKKFTALAASSFLKIVWTYTDEGIAAVGPAGALGKPQSRIPESFVKALKEGARPFGLCLTPTSALLGVYGSAMALIATLSSDRSAAVLLKPLLLPGALRTLTRQGEQLHFLCGDDEVAIAGTLVGSQFVERERRPVCAATAQLTSGGRLSSSPLASPLAVASQMKAG